MSARRRPSVALLQAELALLLAKETGPRQYMREILEKIRGHSEYYHLVRELRLGTEVYFHQYMRMSPAQFDHLLALTGERLSHPATHRVPITTAERLCLTLK